MANAFPLVFVVFLVVAGVFGYLSYQAQQKRMKEIQLLCLNRGWTYIRLRARPGTSAGT